MPDISLNYIIISDFILDNSFCMPRICNAAGNLETKIRIALR